MQKTISIILMITGIISFLGYIFIYHYKYIGRIIIRALVGTVAIGIINYLLLALSIRSGVGINYITIAVAGCLGMPGLFFLYFTVGFLNIFY